MSLYAVFELVIFLFKLLSFDGVLIQLDVIDSVTQSLKCSLFGVFNEQPGYESSRIVITLSVFAPNVDAVRVSLFPGYFLKSLDLFCHLVLVVDAEKNLKCLPDSHDASKGASKPGDGCFDLTLLIL